MGLTPPQSAMAFQSQQEQRFSRPSTSSLTSPAVPGTPLPYIDEGCGLPDNNSNKPASGWGNSTPALGTERSGDKDDPVLGWSSGVPVNVSMPSEPGQSSRKSTAPVDASAAVIVGKTGDWKRLSTPVHQNYLGSFSPAMTPSLRPVSSSFSPALTPLKEVMAPDIESERKSSRAHGSRNQDSAGSSRKMSREQWKRTRKSMNSPGSVLNSFLSEDLRQERRTVLACFPSHVIHVAHAGMPFLTFTTHRLRALHRLKFSLRWFNCERRMYERSTAGQKRGLAPGVAAIEKYIVQSLWMNTRL